jgi:hypothetical protein
VASLVLAYLDPGAGSLLLQLLAGGLAGMAVMGRLFWSRVKRVFRLGRHEPASDEQRS